MLILSEQRWTSHEDVEFASAGHKVLRRYAEAGEIFTRFEPFHDSATLSLVCFSAALEQMPSVAKNSDFAERTRQNADDTLQLSGTEKVTIF